MVRNRIKVFRVVLCAAAVLLSSCSMLSFGGSEATPELKLAVLGVTNDYLRSIAQGNSQHYQETVLWIDYIANKHNAVSKAECLKRVADLKGRYPIENHPLLDLVPLEVSVRGNNAVVRLRKRTQPEAPEIIVKLIWDGSGWVISDDSLFGEKGLLMTGNSSL